MEADDEGELTGGRGLRLDDIRRGVPQHQVEP